MVNKLQQLIMILLLSIGATSYATDFGVQGQTFKVVEESFIAMLKKRLGSVDIEKEQQKIEARAKEQVENPIPVSGVSPATKDRVFYFDPTYVLKKDVVLPCGKILHKAGTRVNPLSHMNFNRRLFFIDAREKEQIAWLKQQLNKTLPKENDKEQVEDRVILVGGSVFKLQEELGELHEDKVYFDQAGELTTKFGIKASPAILEQEGLMIKIKEIEVN
jgi:conjugal transfer pilus assembly protein TraW